MIGAGDLVVCVDDGPLWPNGRPCNLRKGCLYRVLKVVSPPPGYDGGEGLVLAGVDNPYASFNTFLATRFRKIDKADDEFTEMLRRIKPVIPKLEPVKTKVRKLDPAIWGDGAVMGEKS